MIYPPALLNLALSESDFGLKAEWHLFATCHVKSLCSGIGRTVKRLPARISLHATEDNYILTSTKPSHGLL